MVEIAFKLLKDKIEAYNPAVKVDWFNDQLNNAGEGLITGTVAYLQFNPKAPKITRNQSLQHHYTTEIVVHVVSNSPEGKAGDPRFGISKHSRLAELTRQALTGFNVKSTLSGAELAIYGEIMINTVQCTNVRYPHRFKQIMVTEFTYSAEIFQILPLYVQASPALNITKGFNLPATPITAPIKL